MNNDPNGPLTQRQLNDTIQAGVRGWITGLIILAVAPTIGWALIALAFMVNWPILVAIVIGLAWALAALDALGNWIAKRRS